MKLRAVHKDGKTHVFNAESGEELTNCCACSFVHDVRDKKQERFLEVTIRDSSPEIEIHDAEAKIILADIILADVTELTDTVRRAKKVSFREFT